MRTAVWEVPVGLSVLAKGKSHAVNDMKSREVFGISMKCMKFWGLALEKKLNCASKALKTIK